VGFESSVIIVDVKIVIVILLVEWDFPSPPSADRPWGPLSILSDKQ
jgi:hypothetical protein